MRPLRAHFSSGPCPKPPGWALNRLTDACLGRSHRSRAGKAKLARALERTRHLLELPADYRVAVMPGSDTGAVEAALWSMLGARGVDVLAWESFGADWVTDITGELRLDDVHVYRAPYGQLPDLGVVDWERDVVFTWNGTTSGVRVPDGDWIAASRGGLAICDATSAVFAMELPWEKLDVVTFSWQKVLGGEAAHGMLILSPRAVQRLLSYRPPRPLPKLFRLVKDGVLDEALFQGSTINTPSMLCVEDYLVSLDWAESVGGLPGLRRRSRENLQVVEEWVANTAWVEFLAAGADIRSSTSICLSIVAPDFMARPQADQRRFTAALADLLEEEGVAFDINGYRSAPPGLRLWGGATVDTDDLRALTPWLDWGFRCLQ